MIFFLKKIGYAGLFLVLSGVSTGPTGMPPAIIEGRIILEEGQKPLGHVYVYIVAGEEEAITDKDGKFSIHTWQPFPLSLTAEHHLYKKQHIRVEKPEKNIVIKLALK